MFWRLFNSVVRIGHGTCPKLKKISLFSFLISMLYLGVFWIDWNQDKRLHQKHETRDEYNETVKSGFRQGCNAACWIADFRKVGNSMYLYRVSNGHGCDNMWPLQLAGWFSLIGPHKLFRNSAKYFLPVAWQICESGCHRLVIYPNFVVVNSSFQYQMQYSSQAHITEAHIQLFWT